MPSTYAENKTQPATAEVTRIMINSMVAGAIPPEDARYVGQLVAQHTGMTQQEAEKRVQDTYDRAQAKLKEIESENPSTAPFAAHMRTLVTNFDLKRYMSVLAAMRKRG